MTPCILRIEMNRGSISIHKHDSSIDLPLYTKRLGQCGRFKDVNDSNSYVGMHDHDRDIPRDHVVLHKENLP